MTEDDWQQQHARAILAAFQTGRPVFADSKGVLRYMDGAREELADDVGVPKAPLPAARKMPGGDANGPPLSMVVLACVVVSGLLLAACVAMLFGGV